jgi:hypothetical protein
MESYFNEPVRKVIIMPIPIGVVGDDYLDRFIQDRTPFTGNLCSIKFYNYAFNKYPFHILLTVFSHLMVVLNVIFIVSACFFLISKYIKSLIKMRGQFG